MNAQLTNIERLIQYGWNRPFSRRRLEKMLVIDKDAPLQNWVVTDGFHKFPQYITDGDYQMIVELICSRLMKGKLTIKFTADVFTHDYDFDDERKPKREVKSSNYSLAECNYEGKKWLQEIDGKLEILIERIIEGVK